MSNRMGIGKYSFPGDLFIVVLVGLWLIATGTGQLGEFTGRVALGIVSIFVAPGYALVSALFPESKLNPGILSGPTETPVEKPMSEESRVTNIERLLLGIGMSICLVPLIGIGLHYSPWEISQASLSSAVGATTVLLGIIAMVRRLRVPLSIRFDPKPFRFVFYQLKRLRTVQARSNVTFLLIIVFLIAASGIGYAALSPDRGEQYTEFYLLTENSETGELVAGEYPDEIVQGQEENVHVGITNEEGQTLDYTVVIVLESIGQDGTIQERETLDTFSVRVDPGETWQEPHAISADTTGENLRVSYLLYVGSSPETPRSDNAYRDAHFWTDVVS